jgi:heptosyltransferase III
MKILLAKLNHLGDTLLLTPTLRRLRAQFPNAQVDVLVRRGCEVMLQGNPDVNRVVAIAPPEKSRRTLAGGLQDFGAACRALLFRGYDYAFDLSDSDRAKFWIFMSLSRTRVVNVAYESRPINRWLFNRLDRFKWAKAHMVLRDYRVVADALGLEGEPGPLVFEPQIEKTVLKGRVPDEVLRGGGVIIHPTSRWDSKQWVPERWAEVADRLSKQMGVTVAITGGPAPVEVAHAEAIRSAARTPIHVLTGRLSLPETAWVIGSARLFLGVDTVAMHLAAAMQTPAVALFGSTSEWSWHPWQSEHELVLGDCECKRPPRNFACDRSKMFPCMVGISVAQVLRATENLMDRTIS